MKANQTTYEAVRTTLDNWAESYARRDIQRLLAAVAPDLDVVMYGTGVDEKRTGLSEIRAQAERDWSQTDAAAFIFSDVSVSAAGQVAWASADMMFHVEVAGQAMDFPARFTGVFEQRDNRWLVVQAHFSLPAGGQDEGSSVPA